MSNAFRSAMRRSLKDRGLLPCFSRRLGKRPRFRRWLEFLRGKGLL